MKTQISIPKTKSTSQIKYIAVFGSADVDEKHPLYQETFNIARTLAYHDKVIVNGGGPGTMDAATKGAQSAGGQTIAVTFYPKDMPEFEGRHNENKVDEEIKTANYVERLFGLLDHSDAFIIMRGGTGTLSEWSTAWLLAHLYYGKHKPIILYGSFWRKFLDAVNEHFFIGNKENQVYRIVKDEGEMIESLNFFEKELEKRGLPR
ncbi:MAG: LOG family protein [Patescibacteria group bacterium]